MHTHDTHIKLATLVGYWTADGWTKDQAVKRLVRGRLALDKAKGGGNAARRRIDRLDDEAEAKAFEQELYESRMLTEADIDEMARIYDR
jgi:hypothetical protein